ncbi:MAG: diaminopimelate epimerase [Myxococcota bacterium]|nr:diaminopimelate epimerase [Myxococcota bacterium]
MTASHRQIPFTKMHGAGNDFVVLDGLREDLPGDLRELSQRMADRHLGIGCDQILVVRESRLADFRMEIFNPDGSQVEMCANGIRAFFKYLRDAGHTDADELGVETLSGVVRPRWAGDDRVRVDMAHPILVPAKIPTQLGEGEGPVLDVELDVPTALSPDGSGTVLVSSISMGNPHAIIEVPDVDQAPVAELGAYVENHSAFPNRVNVEFIRVQTRNRIQQRTWERGTGETLACGSGACAVAVSAMLRGAVDRSVVIELRGGELEIEWADNDAHVFMTGPAAEVFTGEFPLTNPQDH